MPDPYSPKILKSMMEICVEMGVGTETVKSWIDQGAPIAAEGEGARARYSCEAAQLQAWRLAQSERRKSQ